MKTQPPKFRNYVTERFKLHSAVTATLEAAQPKFGGTFGEFIYYRTYSRVMENGRQEQWADTIIRVIEGIMSIRKQHYFNNNIHWNENFWQDLAKKMAYSLFKMEWMPPGRGLWAMGTEYIYQRGGMSLYNCAFTEIAVETMAEDIGWLMDCLMNGVGVGFAPLRDFTSWSGPGIFRRPNPNKETTVIIGDDREGWVESTVVLIESYLEGYRDQGTIKHDYSEVRPEGKIIHGFGGTASGPKPLEKLHNRIRTLFSMAIRDEIDIVKLKTDIANATGCCVVAGNIRRSAEMGSAPIDDPVFKNLKDYNRYPDRADIGHMSNNSVILSSPADFEKISEIAERVRRGEDLGYLNMVNIRKGRLGHDSDIEPDIATGINPCGEIPLEHREVCNVAETLPTRCQNTDDWLRACAYATFYCSTVGLLPTHRRSTNAIILKNRRIGVGIIDVSGWMHTAGVAKVIRSMRKGYNLIKRTNHKHNSEAGVPDANRVTTIKPGGTTPKVAGKTPGISQPTFIHTLMNIRVPKRWPGCQLLVDAGIPHEPELVDPEVTWVFSIPVKQGPAKPAMEVSIWEQAMTLCLVQREWADNAVSNTLYYRPKWKFDRSHSKVNPQYIRQWLYNCMFEEKADEVINAFEETFESEISSTVQVANDLKIIFKFNEDTEQVNMEIWKFDPKHEEDALEAVLAHIAPLTKSVALSPHSEGGAFAQMPQQGITEEEYERRLAAIQSIDWSQLKGSDGVDEKFCGKENCSIERFK